MYGLYAITNFIWTISLYLSNATGYLIQEAYSLDFISSTADSIGEEYADPCRRYHRRLVLGGLLYRVPAESHSGGGALRCLHRAYQTGNHKSHPCRCEFRGGCSCCLLPLSPMLLIISGNQSNFPQTSAMPA